MLLLVLAVALCATFVIGGRKTLKPLFHLLSVLLMLPSFFFALACLVTGEATKRTLFYFLDVIVSFLGMMYPWGALVLLVCLAALLAAGFRARWRRRAAGIVVTLVVSSVAVMHWIAGLPDNSGQWWFFVPGILSLLIAGCLFATSGPDAGVFFLQWPDGPCLDRNLRENAMAAFQGKPGFRLRTGRASGWRWYHLPAFQDGLTTIDIELGFHDGVLRQISLFHDNPAVYGTARTIISPDNEQLRAEKTRAWLRAKGYPVGSYFWGEVWANYDPRADFGSGGVRYAARADHPVTSTINPDIKLRVPSALALLTGFAFAMPLSAQSPSAASTPSFEQALRGVRSELLLDKNGFSGSAAPVLAKAVAESRFVLIGEDHFTRDIPQFTAAVCDQMAAQGLFALATEASPQAAAFVGAMLDASDRATRLATLLKKYPDCMAFLNSASENDLAAHAAQVVKAKHGPEFQLWGLDQEFLGSAGWLLDQILATHPGSSATAALTHLQAEEQKDAALAHESGDPSKLFLFAADDAALVEADALLQREGSPVAITLFHALVESREIYLKNAHGSLDANAHRARLFKQNFRQRLEAATAAGQKGKVLVKLGDWHLYKGFNPLHQRDLGNYIAEFADGQGDASLHICVLGAKGTHRLYGGYARPMRTEPFVLSEDPDYHWIKPALDNQLTSGWTLYDLRELRARALGAVEPAMSRLIDGYDLLVIIPELTPADTVE